MKDQRLDPEKLLKIVQAEERQDRFGKLKIYLGAAPGVGKTYTMLQDANAKRQQGLDVVVGVVESHGRKDIEDLLHNLEILPKRQVKYKDKQFVEFDLDAALKRGPALILMDEMAHSNIEGVRHTKRWQDIKELLDRGIDVYTTLNVQHIESLNDDVASIIHAPIKETVPDSMLDLAATIELVDLPPEDLLKRLQEGKVYIPEQAIIAKDNFFRKGNLSALRELALRVTAERVGAQVLLYRQGAGIQHIWSSNEKILVCVGPGQECLQLIRAARRLATTLQAAWLAVYVDSQRVKVSEKERNNAIENLRIAEQLGAEIKILSGIDIVTEIMNYAHEQNITLIMIWKHIRPRWEELWRRHLADEIVRHSEEINVYIITGSVENNLTKTVRFSLRRMPKAYLYALSAGLITLITIINVSLLKIINAHILSFSYLIIIVFMSFCGYIGPSIFIAILSIFSYAWLLYPVLFNISITNVEYFAILTLIIILIQIISYLNIVSKKQTAVARISEKKATALHRLSRQLASARGISKLLEIGAKYIADFFNSDVMVLMPKNQQLSVNFKVDTDKDLDAKDLGVAQWVYDLGQMAGLGTDTLSQNDAIYIPLLASQSVLGVLRIHPKNPEKLFTPDQMQFLDTCANQIALTMEVDQLQEQRKKAEMKQEIDNMRNTLLQSMSQDLRAPLSAIMLAANSQIQSASTLNMDGIRKFAQTIHNEAEQLSSLINNVLQITYLESNAIKLQKKQSSLDELVKSVIHSLRGKLGKTPIYIQLSPMIPLIAFDKILMEGVMMNLLDNALKFSPNDQAIDILAMLNDDHIIVCIEDRGPGIDIDEVTRLFDKFYRGHTSTAEHGLGLGLTICRIIVEAHGGQIWAENRVGGGSIFKFTLPLTTH